MAIEYITSKELKDFYNQLGVIIEELDTTNPFEVIGFANSLVSMGNQLLSQSNAKLISKAYSKHELEKYKEKIKKPIGGLKK